jgi:hypothetical protein
MDAWRLGLHIIEALFTALVVSSFLVAFREVRAGSPHGRALVALSVAMTFVVARILFFQPLGPNDLPFRLLGIGVGILAGVLLYKRSRPMGQPSSRIWTWLLWGTALFLAALAFTPGR